MGSEDIIGRDAIQSGESLNRSLHEAEKGFEYFWKGTDVFSQWHWSKFTIDGITFSCAEQYMMYSKATLLHDDAQAKRILASKNQAEMKSLGRGTKQYNEAFWRQQCLHVVKNGNKAKFSQNDYLKEVLFSTYPKILVEASPHDKIWGIGLRKNDEGAWNQATWEGSNFLGFILTEVRDEMMCESGIIQESDKKVYFDKLMDEVRRSDICSKYDRSLHDTRENSQGAIVGAEDDTAYKKHEDVTQKNSESKYSRELKDSSSKNKNLLCRSKSGGNTDIECADTPPGAKGDSVNSDSKVNRSEHFADESGSSVEYNLNLHEDMNPKNKGNTSTREDELKESICAIESDLDNLALNNLPGKMDQNDQVPSSEAKNI